MSKVEPLKAPSLSRGSAANQQIGPGAPAAAKAMAGRPGRCAPTRYLSYFINSARGAWIASAQS
jgi:hypothetical protein